MIKSISLITNTCIPVVVFIMLSATAQAADMGAIIDGNAPGWVALGQNDFAKVNSADDTWSFKDNEIHCTGRPVSVMRSKKQFTNFSQ